MQTLRVGFIGAGFISHFHAQAMKYVRNVELVGVYSQKNSERLAEQAKSLGIGNCVVYNSVKELCKNCDAVAIFVPNFARLEIVRQIADAVREGAALKGVMCEKPLGRTLAEAREMLKTIDDVKLKTIYFENQIHMKPIKAQLKQLEPQQKTMGPLTLARCAEEHAGPHEGWFWDPTKQGGGVLSDMGCHSIACAWFCLTPTGKPLTFLEPIEISCDVALLKWGQPAYRKQLLDKMGVDYSKTPAEDFCTGVVTFMNPETGQQVKAQFTNSWMYDKQGLRLYMDGIGPGYAFELSTLRSSLEIFIGDAAAEAAADAETALEKATASRGLLAVQHNEADLYGYVDEMEDARDALLNGTAPLADWAYGVEITRLVMAGYLAAERRCTLDLTDEQVKKDLETYVPLIAQGRGKEILQVR